LELFQEQRPTDLQKVDQIEGIKNHQLQPLPHYSSLIGLTFNKNNLKELKLKQTYKNEIKCHIKAQSVELGICKVYLKWLA